MRVLLCISFIIAACYGSQVTWTDFRGGNVALPVYEKQAKANNWVACEEDTTLKITWYRKYVGDSFAVAFDQKGSCAGTQITILDSEIDSDFKSSYKQSNGIYEVTKLNGALAYKSTALFTTEKVLKNGGRTLGSYDNVAQDVYIKINGKYTLVSKEGCTTTKTYTEQSCQSNYGLVFTSFTSKSTCTGIKPFYTIYDPTSKGSLIGFGWLSFHKVSSQDVFFKDVSSTYVKNLFPQTPSCLNSCSNFAVVDVWLSYTDSQNTYCSESSWTTSHCKSSSKKKNSSSSSDSSDSSDSSVSSDSSDSSSD